MIINIPKALRIVTALSAFILLSPPAARAQTVNNDSGGIIPSKAGAIPEYDLSQGEETHPMIRLTPDKPQIVHLDSDARSIIVGNQQHLNAVLDSTRSMILIPRDPGATHITVIGKDGSIIMERYVIVAGPAEKYIRIRRNCAPVAGATGGGSGGACAQTTVYYCPDMCHETKILASTMGQPAAPPPRPLASSEDTAPRSGAENPASDSSVSGGAPAAQAPTVKPAPENPAANPSEEH
jgi:hypothetical protein